MAERENWAFSGGRGAITVTHRPPPLQEEAQWTDPASLVRGPGSLRMAGWAPLQAELTGGQSRGWVP